MNNVDRPLSPHLQIYKWPLNMATSIMHRASGIGLSAGAIALVFWLVCVSLGPDAYAVAHAFFSSVIGIIVLMLWGAAFFFHLCNGIRHLFWDSIKGFAVPTAFKTGLLVIVTSAALTVAAWIIGFVVTGGGV